MPLRTNFATIACVFIIWLNSADGTRYNETPAPALFPSEHAQLNAATNRRSATHSACQLLISTRTPFRRLRAHSRSHFERPSWRLFAHTALVLVACDKKLKTYGAIKRRAAQYTRIAVLWRCGVAETIADVRACHSAVCGYGFLWYYEGAGVARGVLADARLPTAI